MSNLLTAWRRTTYAACSLALLGAPARALATATSVAEGAEAPTSPTPRPSERPAPSPPVWAASAKLALVLPGQVSVEPKDLDVSVDLDTETGVAALGKADLWVTPWLSTGLQGMFAYTTIDVPDDVTAFLQATRDDERTDDEANVVNAGLTLKGHARFGALRLSPGLALAYQMTFAKTYDDTVKGFSPGAFVELAWPASSEVRGVAELGFISQPWGGNADFDVTFGPMFYFALGVEYGR